MITYEQLLMEADSKGLITKEKNLPISKGRIKGNRIAIKRGMTEMEKKCVMAEELGHYYTGTGVSLTSPLFPTENKKCMGASTHITNLLGLWG